VADQRHLSSIKRVHSLGNKVGHVITLATEPAPSGSSHKLNLPVVVQVSQLSDVCVLYLRIRGRKSTCMVPLASEDRPRRVRKFIEPTTPFFRVSLAVRTWAPILRYTVVCRRGSLNIGQNGGRGVGAKRATECPLSGHRDGPETIPVL
jgi:hypothetical protein